MARLPHCRGTPSWVAFLAPLAWSPGGRCPREQQEAPLLASVKELHQQCPGSPRPLGQWVVPAVGGCLVVLVGGLA